MSFPSGLKNVFITSGDKSCQATIASPFFGSKYYEYELAYKRAGDILVTQAIADASLFLSVSIYPITFLYRQFLELYIKDILLRFDSDFDGEKKPYSAHDVYPLWQKLLDIVRLKIADFPKQLINMDFVDVLCATDAYFAEISALDKGSMSFRYPDNKTHKEDFFKKEIPVDIKNLKDRIDELANILFLIDETLTNIQTMEEELISQLF